LDIDAILPAPKAATGDGRSTRRATARRKIYLEDDMKRVQLVGDGGRDKREK
jgi:hypothetical protein